jgi:hypothetical protein
VIAVEYLTGSLSTLIVLFVVAKFFFKNENINQPKNNFTYSQSHIHEIIKPLLSSVKFEKKKINRQSRNHEERTNVKVIILEDKAYWVIDNIFYVADINENGFDKNNAQVLDIINMDRVQLDKIMFIVDKLRDGK